VAPAALIDLVPAPRGTAMPADLADHLGEGARRAAGGWAAAHLLPEYYAEMNTRRQHEVALRRQYLEFSLDHLRSVAQGRMFDAEGKMESDEKYRIAYLSAKQKYDELTARRTARRTQLAQEGQLIRQAPAFVTAVAVLPLPVQARTHAEGALPAGFDLRRNDEVERIAMEATMAYERGRGWQPADVSAENLGFDVRSVHPDGIVAGIRCIEVKGRHNAGGVLLTGNEWIKARRIADDFWLYIVSNCFAKPQLQVIQNPAAHLHPEELQEIVRYFVPPAAWQRAATVVAIEGEGATADDPDPDPPV